jgi:hypothetical protein
MTRRDLRCERGVTMVLFAVILPLLLFTGVIVADVGNWWVHGRHLQTQVDAAALAAGPQFVGCFHDPTDANAAIASRALGYAGDTLRPGTINANATPGTTNLQVQTPNDIRVVLNGATYWTPSAPGGSVPGTNGYGLDYTLDSADADTQGDPCNEKYLDVKATDHVAPLLWGLIPVAASPKRRAKVEIRDITSGRGMLPWAVPEIDPARVAVLFVNEQNGAVFDWQYLVKDPSYDNDANGATPYPYSAWTTAAGQEPVTLGSVNDRTSVVVLVSKNNANPSMPAVGGTLASACNASPGLIKCYAGTSQTSGLSFIHAYSGGNVGTMTSPVARQVYLTAVGCSAADLSAAYFTLDGDCGAAVQAVIDFGGSGDPRDAPTCALVDGMTWTAGGLGGTLGTWTSTGTMSLPAGSGRQELDLQTHTGPKNNDPTQCPTGNSRPNDPNLGVVAAPYVANAASGPVKYMKLTATLTDGTPVTDANSVEKDNYLYRITVGIPKPLSIANYADPPLLLRMASPSGSQNQAFDCDSNINFEDEINDGCQTTYKENYVDPDGPSGPAPYQWNNLLCTGWNTTNLPPPTFGPGPSPYPSDCVITETGDKTGQLRQGLKLRFETPCVPNNWPDNSTEAATFFGPNGGGYGSDPRYVTLIITDNTAFSGSGNEALPIKYFAGFYVTGWDLDPNGNGPSNTQGCPDPDGPGPLKGNDCHPVYGCTYQHTLDNGDVWGYFVNVVTFSSEGTPSDKLCDFGGAPAACVAVLTE